MFEIDKLYDVVMLEIDDSNGEMSNKTDRRKVVNVAFPLVEFKDDEHSGETIILNTASLAFVSAQAVDLNVDKEDGSGFDEN